MTVWSIRLVERGKFIFGFRKIEELRLKLKGIVQGSHSTLNSKSHMTL